MMKRHARKVRRESKKCERLLEKKKRERKEIGVGILLHVWM